MRPFMDTLFPRPQAPKPADEPLTPRVDVYANGAMPGGRGTEQHGVTAPYSTQSDPEPYDVHGYDAVVMDPPPHRPEPILVTVVHDETDAPEIKTWRVLNTTATNIQANRIVGQDRARTNLTVKNGSTTAVLWVGHNESVSANMNGFPIPPGASQTFGHTEDVWAITDTADVTPIFAIVEYTVNR